MDGKRLWFGVPTLEERFQPRDNALGLLRLVFALMVLVAHTWPLGFAWPGLGWLGVATQGRANELALYGFFLLSGYLITGSGLTTTVRVFARHRFLRIFPGYWACLLLTVGVFAPVTAWYEHAGTDWIWGHRGALGYLWTNLFASMEQYGIGDLLTTVPYRRVSGGSVFDGSLWSLKYELACYLVVAVLAGTGLLRRRPWVVPAVAVAYYLVIAVGFLAGLPSRARPVFAGAVGPFPLLGSFNVNQVVYLAFVFFLGASIRLYGRRLPMHGAIAAACVVALGVSVFLGGSDLIGLPAFAYLVFYLAVAAPRRLHRVGRRHDYSYGIYLYSFPVTQLAALVGANRWGLGLFVLVVVAATLALAIPSWHLIERPAMRRKDRPLGRLPHRGPRPAATAGAAPAAAVPAETEPVLGRR
ncbi:MAG TPA: acyltransferase [Rugosimonospora sp.]|nr:acyltransferase [Rugosimonospora sp.]